MTPPETKETFLVDVMVWMALLIPAHTHHKSASLWLATKAEERSLFLCRNTQTGILRLLTQRAVMGSDVLTQSGAWRALDEMVITRGVKFLDEPFAVEAVFRRISSRHEISPKRWQDDYLAAFAEAGNLTLVTFDRALAGRIPSATLLEP